MYPFFSQYRNILHVLQLLQRIVAAAQSTAGRQIAVNEARAQRFEFDRAVQDHHSYIAEPVISKTGAERFNSVAFKDVFVGLKFAA